MRFSVYHLCLDDLKLYVGDVKAESLKEAEKIARSNVIVEEIGNDKK